MSPTSVTNLIQYNDRWKIFRKLTGRVILIQLGKSSRQILVRINLLQTVKKWDGSAPSSNIEQLTEWGNTLRFYSTMRVDHYHLVSGPTNLYWHSHLWRNKESYPGNQELPTSTYNHSYRFQKCIWFHQQKCHMSSVLHHYRISEVTVNAISVLYNKSKSAVMVYGNIPDIFQVTTDVLQGNFLVPCLFYTLNDY